MPVGPIPESATVVAAESLLSSRFDEELVILNLESGIYYGLEQVGARIWDLIKRPVRVGSIRDTLVSEYQVDPGRCERDLQALLKDLAAKGLVRIELA
ncbi:MAG: PqqD family protein [Gemmatimonadetes bacterium]|nr:PqqD family protein [Gemmatimonadota bacterium]